MGVKNGAIGKMEAVIIGAFALLILANVLGSINSDLDTQLSNAETHPNGALTMTVIGFFVLAFAIHILMGIFKQDGEQDYNRPNQFIPQNNEQ